MDTNRSIEALSKCWWSATDVNFTRFFGMKEQNPFEEKEVAEQWILSVESEKGMIRDNETYPALHAWFLSTDKGVVLEIGSGQGICSSKIEGYGHYIGIEPSAFLVTRAKELYESPLREFLVGDAYHLPKNNGSCDAVFSVNVWFHLEDVHRASKELFRVLKNKGKFFIHTADRDAFNVWKSFYTNATIQGKKVTGTVSGPGIYQTTNIFYGHTNEEVIEALEKAGLTVSKITKLGTLKDSTTIFIAIEGEKRDYP